MMAWWRRDPSLLSRSPVHRYAQRILRNHEAVLRTRCFSRTPGKYAQLKDDDGGKRPHGMSDLDWELMQRYKQWTKRLVDDPYNALFGASNDMLNGKGLRDWEWIHKKFPRWMLQDMDLEEMPKKNAKDRHDGTPDSTIKTAPVGPEYPKKVEIIDENGRETGRQESRLPQASYSAGRFERDTSSGVVSPSDLRRPRESSYVKVVSNPSSDQSSISPSTNQTIISPSASTLSIDLNPSTLKNDVAKDDQGRLSDKIEQPYEDIVERKPDKRSWDESLERNNSWRETTLQRRLSSQGKDDALSDPSPRTIAEKFPSKTLPSDIWTPGPVPIPSSQATDAILGDQSSEIRFRRDAMRQTEERPKSSTIEENARSLPPRSTSQILSQLPEEDIDFLSAAEIRANMGIKRKNILSDEERKVEREKLEQQFVAASESVQELNGMVGAQVINNQLIRRKVRKMRESQEIPEARQTQATELKESTAEPPAAVEATPVESSIDRMKRWLETTGASFAKQFWQDPTEPEDITKSRLFFDKAYHYIRKGRAAMTPIVEDLERDVPASKVLLQRLKRDEETLEYAVQRLRQRSLSGTPQCLSPRKIRAMESIKTRFHQTNTELEKAYTALQEFASSTTIAEVPQSFKRRLSVASKVLHKNTQLSRMLIYSLQARLEDPKIDRNILPNYKLVADDLLSLRDTQMTLTRLVDRAMLVYGVAPQTDSHGKSPSTESVSGAADFENCDEPYIRARLAADAHLINEINEPKSSMQETAKEESASKPRPISKTLFDEPKPLAHSLFRPFGPVFAQLGMKTETNAIAEKAKEEEEKRVRDDALVSEIKKAYEDTYGPITAEHRQMETETRTAVKNEEATVTRFEMLKNDPVEVEREVISNATLIDSTPNHTASISPREIPAEMSESSLSAQETEQTTVAASATEPPKALINEGLEMSPSVEDPPPAPKVGPTHYTIIIRDPETDSLTITTSTSDRPHDESPTMPLHQALSALDAPAKFIQHIDASHEIVSANKDILVLRDSINCSTPFNTRKTIPSPNSTPSLEDCAPANGSVNPIDGTTRLSPTGYVGPEESPEQLEKEFKERREAAGRFNRQQQSSYEQDTKAPRRGKTGAGIVKTAIWATALCYVVGVFGEIATSPFKV